MKTKALLVTGSILALLGGAPALAADKAPATTDAGAAAAGTAATGSAAGFDPAVGALPYHDIDGMDVHGANGDEIGELEGLYRHGGKLYARMQVAPHWYDISEPEVMVPLDAFHMNGDELVLPITEEQANALEQFAEGDYEELADDLGYDTLAEAYEDAH